MLLIEIAIQLLGHHEVFELVPLLLLARLVGGDVLYFLVDHVGLQTDVPWLRGGDYLLGLRGQMGAGVHRRSKY